MNKISSKHFILFILGTSIVSIKTYLSVFIDIGGRDTWLASLIAGIIFILFLLLIINIYKSTNSCDINEIFFKALPTPIAFIFMLVFVLALFINSIECGAVEANVLHTTLFIDTPVWYALIFFLVPSFFILTKKIRTILIFVLICVGIFIINSLVFLLLAQPYEDITYLLPVLGSGLNIDFFKTILLILGGLSSFMISIPFFKFVDKHEHINKHCLYSGAITVALIVTSFLGAITTFGPIRAANIFYPEFIIGQRIQIAGFLEFGELFFITQTVVGLFIKYMLSTYSILLILEKHLKNKHIFIGVYTFLVFIISNFLGANNFYLSNILKYIQIINILAFIFIPLFIYIVYYFKCNKTKNSSKIN